MLLKKTLIEQNIFSFKHTISRARKFNSLYIKLAIHMRENDNLSFELQIIRWTYIFLESTLNSLIRIFFSNIRIFFQIIIFDIP